MGALFVFFGVAVGLAAAGRVAAVAGRSGRSALGWAAIALAASGSAFAAMIGIAAWLLETSEPAAITAGVLAPCVALLVAIAVGVRAARRPAASLIDGLRIPAEICIGADVTQERSEGPYRSSNPSFVPSVLVLTEATLDLEVPGRRPELIAYRSLVGTESQEECVVLRWTTSEGGQAAAAIRLQSRAEATTLARRIQALRPQG